ncbi:MAG: hypothetical protein AAB683_01020 [Patescibacteria group bacterium]
MSNIVFYSFRTNKVLKEFQENGIPVFVFGSLKKDFELFSEILKKEKPDRVLGLAAISGKSRSEAVTINRFGRIGKVSKDGKDSYVLENIGGKEFRTSKTPTTSFCNWTIYRTREFIEKNGLKSQVSFIHFNQADTKRLTTLCQALTNPI